MFKLTRAKYITALQSAEAMEEVLMRENERIEQSRENLFANWQGMQSEKTLRMVRESQESGSHAKALAYAHGMTTIMSEYLPEIEKLMAKREQIGEQLKQDEYKAPDLSCFQEEELIIDYSYIDNVKADVEGALYYGDAAIRILREMMTEAEQYAGEYLDFSEAEELLEEGERKLHRLENYRDEFVDFGKKMSDLEYNMSSDLSRVIREQGDWELSLHVLGSTGSDQRTRMEQMEKADIAAMLEERGLTREQYTAALLDTFMYLDFFNDDEDNRYEYTEIEGKIHGGMTISELLDILGEIDLYTEGGEDSTRNIYYQILTDAVKMDPSLGKYEISLMSRKLDMEISEIEYNEGTNGMVFTDPVTDIIYVAFRGTSTGEWGDDGERFNCQSTEDLTIQMEQTLHYFNYVAKTMGWTEDDTIYVTGHSQGGNDAQICMLLSEYGELVEHCYSFDGEGHSPELLRSVEEKWGPEEYEYRRSRMYSICGEYDFVNHLGEKVIPEENTIYIKCNFELQDIAKYHDIVSMFCDEGMNYNGMINTGIGTFPSWVTHFTAKVWEELYEMPPELRASCQASIMNIAEIGLSKGDCKVGLNGEKASWNDYLATILYAPDMLKESGIRVIDMYEKELALDLTEYLLNAGKETGILSEKSVETVYDGIEACLGTYADLKKGAADLEQEMEYMKYELGEKCMDLVLDASVEAAGAVQQWIEKFEDMGREIIFKSIVMLGSSVYPAVNGGQ